MLKYGHQYIQHGFIFFHLPTQHNTNFPLKIFMGKINVLPVKEIFKSDILKNVFVKSLVLCSHQPRERVSKLHQSWKRMCSQFPNSVASCKQHCPVYGQGQSEGRTWECPPVCIPPWLPELSHAVRKLKFPYVGNYHMGLCLVLNTKCNCVTYFG